MANNRMYLVCKHKSCKKAKGLCLAKFYPSGGFIAGEGAGWYPPYEDLSSRLEEFFNEHQHDYDKSNFGGYQYSLSWDVTGDGTSPVETVFEAIKKFTP